MKRLVVSWRTKLNVRWEDSCTGGRLACWTDMREEPILAQAKFCEMPPLHYCRVQPGDVQPHALRWRRTGQLVL